ncbi:hypothetical protein FKW77_007324 [Venturia effusa]|uniref:BTB domain-containing protein n=1 Tax=Venturia effusa TaxID=50376 RepID=A0A517L1K5_9PEZI|nr:hypothetical protein FKW77_007324 [Venturia effusa]
MAAETDTCKMQLDETLDGLFQSGEFSDLTITCNGVTFNVHKSVVCFQSRFSRNAVKQGAFMEGETGVVDMPDDDPDAVKAMLQFLYSRGYVASPELEAMPLHARTYCLARKLDLVPLIEYASEHLGRAMLNDTPSPSDRRGPTAPHPEVWASTVYEIYANTAEDDKIRKLVLIRALQNLFWLLKDKDNAFSTMMSEMEKTVHSGAQNTIAQRF